LADVPQPTRQIASRDATGRRSMIRLITAAERLADAERKTSMVVVGRAKVGKTSLLLGLPERETIVLDFEAGLTSVEGRWHGDSVPLRSWIDTINLACLLAGPDPSRPPTEAFSEEHYHHVVELGSGVDADRYRYIFVDSITDLTRVAMAWAKTQPAAFSDRSGRPDTRGAYGLLGREVVGLLKHLQHAAGKSVVFVGGLDRARDELGRVSFRPKARRPAPSCRTSSIRWSRCRTSTSIRAPVNGRTISARASTARSAAGRQTRGAYLRAIAAAASI